jgi:putative ABC transport system permease protein
VYRSFPPTDPFAELVMATAGLPTPLPPPDFYLAHLAPGASAGMVADDVRRRATGFTVSTIGEFFIQERRSLTALDLRGLGRLEAVVAALVAAVGVAVLGAFLVLERRRESAILHAVGATTGQVVAPPVVEGAIAVFGSLIIGMPIGVGLAMLTIRVLGLFFTLPPPLVVLPTAALAGLAGLMVLSSALALGLAVAAVARQRPGVVLREP